MRLAGITLLVAWCGVASADDLPAAAPPQAAPSMIENQPEKRAASVGFFAEGGLGAVAFTPKVGKDAAPGPALNIRMGRDLFSWLSIGVAGAISTHQATLPPPPDGQYFQLYRAAADVRAGGRINRLSIFAEGQVGLAIISSNVLEPVMITKVGRHTSSLFGAGVGLEYQILNRHYGVGVAVDGLLTPEFTGMKAFDTRLYLRYTFGGG